MKSRRFEVDKGIRKLVLKNEFEKSFIKTIELIFGGKIIPNLQQSNEIAIISYKK